MASTYLSLNVHVVFSTNGRAPLIAKAWQNDLHGYLGGTIRGLGAVPICVGGIADHVHLLIGIKATHAVADLVREIKKASAVWAAQRVKSFAWQAGYGAFTVGAGEVDRVRAYIENQEEHHRTVTAADEMRALLAEFGIEVDERYFE